VDQHHIGIAAPGRVEGLAGAEGDHLHGDAGLGLEQRQQVLEQAGLLGGGGGGDDDRGRLGPNAGGGAEGEQEAEGYEAAAKDVQGSSPVM
jgi:hypothetical protein